MGAKSWVWDSGTPSSTTKFIGFGFGEKYKGKHIDLANTGGRIKSADPLLRITQSL